MDGGFTRKLGALAPLLVLIGLAGISAQAQTFKSFEFYDLNYDSEALGMGNAYTAAAKDMSAMYYNPANLEEADKWKWYNFIQAEGSPSTLFDYLNKFNEVGKIFKNAALSQSEKLNQTFNTIQSVALKNAHARINVASIMTWQGMGLGLNVRAANFDTIVSPDATQMFVRAVSDVSIMGGKSFGFLENRLRVGAVSRLIYRFSYVRTLSLSDILSLGSNITRVFSNDAREGLLLDLDLGATYYPDFLDSVKGRFAVVLAHVFPQAYLTSFNFFAKTNNRLVAREDRRVHLGYAMTLPKFWVFEPTVALDVRNLGLHPGDFFKHLHLGGTLNVHFSDTFGGALRAGLSQGYLSAGITGHVWWFYLDAAYFAEEVGAQSGQNPDRRLLLRFTFQAS
jgi:hypothetical protein